MFISYKMFHVSSWKATRHESQNWKIRVKFRYLHSSANKPQYCNQVREDFDSCKLQKNFTLTTFLDPKWILSNEIDLLAFSLEICETWTMPGGKTLILAMLAFINSFPCSYVLYLLWTIWQHHINAMWFLHAFYIMYWIWVKSRPPA